ncbi:MAG: tRNA (adenosine(37)-N6)-threonylcarbamoyltransferase complex dimerization subunit type 1 TsaB, partial [Balneolaceae bacterium]
GIHSEKLFLFIQELMQEYQVGADPLSAILLSGGPGSYTGLRIGAAAVKGLLFQSDIPLQVLGTLESMAGRALFEQPEIQKIHSVIDARRKHLYHQAFTIRDGMISRSEPSVRSIEKLSHEIRKGELVIGTAIGRLRDEIRNDLQNQVRYLNDSYISSVNLLQAFKHSTFRNRFKKVNSEEYEPDYMSVGQINDSDISV